jgi:hypothetical protein
MEQEKSKFYKALALLAIVGAVLLATKIVSEIKGYRFIGGGVSATNTISVSGDADVYASPDIANISFTVRESDLKVATAQSKVTTKVAAALASVRKLGVDEKDIKTENYSSYPKYEWQAGKQIVCPATASYCPPAPGRQVIVGYEVSQSVTVKVRNIDSVNTVVQGLADAGVTEMQGPNFAIDKQDDLQADARKQAIQKAQAKAEVLAKDLGVTLVRIVSFSENSGGPMYYAKAMMETAAVGMGGAPAPELPAGQTKITSNVTVTYEIR